MVIRQTTRRGGSGGTTKARRPVDAKSTPKPTKAKDTAPVVEQPVVVAPDGYTQQPAVGRPSAELPLADNALPDVEQSKPVSLRAGLLLGTVDVPSSGSAPKAPPRERSASERIRALREPPRAAADEPPAPSAQQLKRMISQNAGHHAWELSALEIASVLGHPGWEDAISQLGRAYVSQESHQSEHFLLAVHLSLWMENKYEGATLDDVAKMFKAANPVAAERFAYLDAALIEVLQQAYDFMPQWKVKPKGAGAVAEASAWDTDDDVDSLLTTKLMAMFDDLSEVPVHMPLTASVGEKLAEDKRFANHNVVMIQHMLGQANPQVDALVNAGMDVDKAEFVGVPYQNNPAVQLVLKRKYGLDVTVPERGNIDSMWDHVCAAIDRAVERSEENGEPILIIDDGGYGSRYIHEEYPHLADRFRVVEQTTRGLTEVSKLDDPQFPISNVAGSYGKRFESAQVGDVVVQTIRNVLDELTATPARKDVLVVGAGKVGLGVANAFKGDGSRVTIFDPYLAPHRKKMLEEMGYAVITDKAKALKKKFLVVGCSGHRSINMDDFAKMSSPVFIASSSSKRVEIDTLGLQDQATLDGVLRRVLAARVNEQETWHYWLKDGTIVTSMADGLPVNFQDVNSIAPELIDHTMALMLLGAGEAVQSAGKKGLVELDAASQFHLQAQMESVSLWRQSADDVEVKLGDTPYFATREEWLAIAKSSATPPGVVEKLIEAFSVHPPKSRAAGRFMATMDPIVLNALSAPKELSDATVDRIIQGGFLPHIAHLARNPELSDDQTSRLMDFLVENYRHACALADDKVATKPSIEALGFFRDGSDQFKYGAAELAMMTGNGIPREDSLRAFQAKEMRTQIASILLPHPRCPQELLDAFVDAGPLVWNQPRADSVLFLKNPRWTAEQLETIRSGMLPPVLGLLPPDFFDDVRVQEQFELQTAFGGFGIKLPEDTNDSVIEFTQRIRFAYDAINLMIEHPSSTDIASPLTEARRILDAGLGDFMNMQGEHVWREHPTGELVPRYD